MNEHIDISLCIYCGYRCECWDHIIPWSYDHFQIARHGPAMYDEGTVPCCNECNGLAGDFVPCSFLHKVLFILNRYEQKYPYESEQNPEEVSKGDEMDLDWGLLCLRKDRYIRQCILKAKFKRLRIVCAGIDNPEIHEEIYPSIRGGFVRVLRTGFRQAYKMGEVLLPSLPEQVDIPPQNKTLKRVDLEERDCFYCGSTFNPIPSMMNFCSISCKKMGRARPCPKLRRGPKSNPKKLIKKPSVN